MSNDHKPTDPSELERIIRAGGYIEDGRVCGSMALTRALGDFEYKDNPKLGKGSQIIIGIPEIAHCAIEKDDIVIVASDGVWDCISNRELANYVENCQSLICAKLLA